MLRIASLPGRKRYSNGTETKNRENLKNLKKKHTIRSIIILFSGSGDDLNTIYFNILLK